MDAGRFAGIFVEWGLCNQLSGVPCWTQVLVIRDFTTTCTCNVNMQYLCIVHVYMHTCTCTHTVHMALVGYFIVFSFVTKPGQTLEFLLWGTIVPLNFLAGYYCSIVASTPQPMAYAFTTYAAIHVNRPSGISQAAAIAVNCTQGLMCSSYHISHSY